MNNRSFIFGIIISVFWIVAMAIVLLNDLSVIKDMKPNEWGDFLAGLSAPLAFLLLVLGYLQQGQELRLNTQALHLQATELKNSVEQQRELVEVTRQQMESEREALILERNSRREAAKPHFAVHGTGASYSGGNARYDFRVSNAGSIVADVTATLHGLSTEPTILIKGKMLDRGDKVEAPIPTTQSFPDTGVMLSLTYRDTEGQPGKTNFKVTKKDAASNSLLVFDQIEE